MSENTCEGAPAVIHVVGFVTASSVGGFDWFWHRGAAEAMRKRHLDQGVPEVTEVREIRLDKLPLDGNHGRDAITNALDDYPELWEPRTSAPDIGNCDLCDTPGVDRSLRRGGEEVVICDDCRDAETGASDPRPDIRNAKAWLMGISDSLKQAERDPSGLDEGSIGLADMAATIDDIVERVEFGIPPTLVDEIRAALEGESNDAEHDALVSVAAHFDVTYVDPYDDL